MRISFILTAAVLTLTSVTVTPQVAQGPSPLLGKWKLDIAQSAYDPGPPPYKRSTCTIEPWEDGLKVTYDMVGIRGGIQHREWLGKLDGNDYPIEGIDDVVTNAYTRIDDRTYDVVVKLDGRKAATARIVISTDDRTLTTVTSSVNSQGQAAKTTTIYVRQ